MPPVVPSAMPHADAGESDNKSTKSRKKGDDIYISAARKIARCIDLWCDVDKVIKTMRLIQLDEASKLGELDEDDTAREVREECLHKIPLESCQDAARTYYKIIQIIPTLKTMIDDPTKSANLTEVCVKMNVDIKGTRSSDATRLKPFVARYCLPNVHDPTSIRPLIVNAKGRAEMGLNHPILARWICPTDQLHIFDANPEQTRKDLASGAIPMEAEDFPALFWSGTLPGQDYNPDDMSHGLFKSYFLVRVARHIFLGPSYAIELPDRKNRACNAVLNDISTIEAEHIAYICIQARFAISSRDTWNERDGNLSYLDMYRCIIKFIRDAIDTEWRDGLLRWWNKEIFGNENGRDSSKAKTTVDSRDGNPAPRMSTMERIHVQMKARAAAVPEDPPLTEDGAPTEDPSFALDPALADFDPTEFMVTQRETTAARRETPAGRSNIASESSVRPSTPLPNLPAGSTVPVTPTRADQTALGSPLSDIEGAESLTPPTNRTGKKGKSARGKRPAPPDDGGEGAHDMGGRTKRSKRTRK